jgi:formylglycine-generating enzyme required for sulfatase activity
VKTIISLFIIAIIVFSCKPEQRSLEYDLGNGQKLKFAFIPKGTFKMGSPENEPHRCPGWWSPNETQHDVTLTKDYYMGITEVTQGQWYAFMGYYPFDDSLHCKICWNDTCMTWKIDSPADRGTDKPIMGVKRDEAIAFCDSLTKRFNVKFRLPTEAEWEYACRAGSNSMFCFGNDTAQLKEYAVYGKSYGKNENVATKKPNKWGLYDMHGSLWEWVLDYYGDFSNSPQVDPKGPSLPDTISPKWTRLMRGGCAVNDAFQQRSACRHKIEHDFCNSMVGFRVLME